MYSNMFEFLVQWTRYTGDFNLWFTPKKEVMYVFALNEYLTSKDSVRLVSEIFALTAGLRVGRKQKTR